jgi:PPOX class probable F420-dependent enzyme
MAKSNSIPEAFLDLLERPLYATLATTLADGTPQATIIWFNYENGKIYFNSAAGRLKDRAIRARPYVSFVVLDPENPFRYIQVRGPVTNITEEGGDEHINALSHRYTGKDYDLVPGQVRVIYTIEPEHVDSHG